MDNVILLLRQDLADARRSEIERTADAMGVARGTLRHIVAGKTRDPRYSTVLRIEAYYRQRPEPSISSPDLAA